MASTQTSIQQIKAARALLGWNQNDLAAAAGLSLPAIAKLESGLTQPRADTINALRGAFEQNGIEFLDSPGVQMRQESFRVDVMHGRDGMHRLWTDIETSMANGGELLLSSCDEVLFLKIFGDKLWATLKRRQSLGIKPRLLIREGDANILGGPDTYMYRTIPAALFSGTTPHYIYLNKMAITQLQPTIQVILIESSAVADTFRAVFEQNWESGKMLSAENLTPIQPPNEKEAKSDKPKQRR